MKPDLLEDLKFSELLEPTHEDRRDNRRAIAVTMVAAFVIMVACVVLLISHPLFG